MKKSVMALLVIACSAMASAHATDCSDATTQTAMNICADQTYKKTDTELNTVYLQVMARLKDRQSSAKLLVRAQRSWVAFRDAECAFTSSASVGGSVYPLLVTQCRNDLTRKRIDALKPLLHCQEGDMSCPVPAAKS